jgi:hypothetical protein
LLLLFDQELPQLSTNPSDSQSPSKGWGLENSKINHKHLENVPLHLELLTSTLRPPKESEMLKQADIPHENRHN